MKIILDNKLLPSYLSLFVQSVRTETRQNKPTLFFLILTNSNKHHQPFVYCIHHAYCVNASNICSSIRFDPWTVNVKTGLVLVVEKSYVLMQLILARFCDLKNSLEFWISISHSHRFFNILLYSIHEVSLWLLLEF